MNLDSILLTLLPGFSLSAIELSLYVLLADLFFPKRWKGAAQFGTVALFSAAVYVLGWIFSTPLPQAGGSLLLYLGLTLLLYRAKPLPAVFTSALWLSVMNLLDELMLCAVSVITGFTLTQLSRQNTLTFYDFAGYLSELTARVLIACLPVFGKKYFRHTIELSMQQFAVVLYPVSAFLCGTLLYHKVTQSEAAEPTLVLCLFLLLVTDVLSLCFLELLARQQDRLNEAKLLQQQLDSAMDNITAAAQSYRNERKLTHDFQNHLLVLRGMLEGTDDREKIVRYLDEVSQYNATSALAVSTNRLAVDVLLNQKYLIAAQKGIAFRFRLDDLSGFPLPDNAFVVLLSSLLDNAIEACARVPNGEREILVKASVAPESCLLCIENSVAGPVEIQNNLIPTTKPNPSRHGYGLKNVAAIVKAYDGFHTLDCDAKRFRFIAEFPGPQRIRL